MSSFAGISAQTMITFLSGVEVVQYDANTFLSANGLQVESSSIGWAYALASLRSLCSVFVRCSTSQLIAANLRPSSVTWR